ncbi:Uncharacterised protein [Zhongshania aliphaticivorans]|uniref:Zorya protein ZorC EH domain-containing protein n=1 Tax=Zhongshania aliphaticivorans TaxID=1470434 RepID=A0A5S9NAV2_9GAMM|nr:EH signature domain-containing protein [Zhongshania aliphaticivorans]CAA0081051.1 Uncharacterised protein [Zhongshania aliphaticivorans]CAA0085302.1 Uncharacterised protein [Zhongshania aliphaticivorans]
MASLPNELSFTLPDWKTSSFEAFRQNERKMKSLVKRAGTNSEKFTRRCQYLRSVVQQGSSVGLVEALSTPIDARAFTYLLASNQNFAKSVSISTALLDALKASRKYLSRLTLLQLIHAFFNFFDDAFSSDNLRLLSGFIKSQLDKFKTSDSNDEFSTFSTHANTLFSANGAANVVQFAIDNGIDLDDAFARLDLTPLASSRFATICNYHYYLETLRIIPVGDDHAILSEIVKPDVKLSPQADGEGLLGHEFLRILIDRSGNSVSDRWQSIVLDIAGDPRVPKTNEKYRRWWAFLDENQIAKVRGWLSKLDLALFLKILEQSAIDSGNQDMINMFKPRRKFMEGLLDQGAVSETRLFLSSWATQYLRKHYNASELPSYAEVHSGQTSMIYLNLQSKVHMIEGSHSFKLTLLDRLPSRFKLTNYGFTKFRDSQIRKEPFELYMSEYMNDEGAQQYVHDKPGNWRGKAINYMRTVGLDIDNSKLMTVQESRSFHQKYGY